MSNPPDAEIFSNLLNAEIFFKSAQRGELLLSGNFGDSVTGTSNDFKDIPVTMEISTLCFHFHCEKGKARSEEL